MRDHTNYGRTEIKIKGIFWNSEVYSRSMQLKIV